MPPRPTRRTAVATLAIATALAAPATALAAATASSYFVGPVDMLASKGIPSPYIGDMPDASVYYENGTYYAYTTSSGGSFVPVYTSTDGMKSWQTLHSYKPPAYAPNGVAVRQDPVFNDGLLGPAKWVQPNPNTSTWSGVASPCPTNSKGETVMWNWCTHMVSPSVVKLASGQYLMAYGAWAKVPGTNNVRMAVTTAIASSPAGPFTDYSTSPFYTWNGGEGAIDPQLFKDPSTGRIYLQWMNQGGNGTADSIVWSQEISVASNGVASKVGSMTKLISTQGAQPWEQNSSGWGTVVEQPSMMRYNGKYYLFYSSQLWTTAKYRMGYAVCNGPLGPCTRASTTFNPLMNSSVAWNQDGPGGGSAFLDAAGKPRLIYQAWPFGKPGYSATNAYQKSTPDRQRFGHVAALDQDGLGNLTVAQRSLALAPVSCNSPDLFPTGNWVNMSKCQYPVAGPNVFPTLGKQPEWWRVAGPSRYDVSASTSRRSGIVTGTPVLIASGTNFPDALAAGPYASGQWPVILVPPTGTLPAATKAELQRRHPSQVTIVGGTGAVSDTMASQVSAAAGVPATRVAGASRYDTAARLSTRPTGRTVYVANGLGFADALPGGVAASRENAPLLLTDPNTLPTVTANAIKARLAAPGVDQIVILGGTASVSTTVEAQLKAIVPNVLRLADTSRYGTAVKVNAHTYPTAGHPVVLVNGANFPDALSAVPFAVKSGSELLLTQPSCMPAVVRGEVDRQAPATTTGIGGLLAVSDKALLHGTC